jgi:pSer/pThr/pTyr-binding forkhead associated (FHA) protein
MATQRLVIDSEEPSRFSLLVENDSITISGVGADGARVLENVRVARVHCELEVESDRVLLRIGKAEHSRHLTVVRQGQVLHGDGSQFVLQDIAAAAAPAPAPTPPPATPASATAKLRKRLLAIAGPDEGRGYPLPDSGVVTIGKDRQYASIVVRGLAIERVHCQIKVENDRAEVVDERASGTLINGKRILRQELIVGDVIRIGNNEFRYETVGLDEEFATSGIPRHQSVDAAQDEEDDREDIEPVPANAPEPIRLLFEWRERLAELVGQQFGHFQLDDVLWRNAYGTVFRATDQKNRQVVALNVLSPQFPHGGAELAHFANIVKQALPLRHENVVTLQGAGKTGNYTWLSSEFVDGEPLTRVIKRAIRDEEYDVDAACQTALHVARALAFARTHKLRHGAISPANILIQKSDQAAKLADLMLGSALEGSQLGQAVVGFRTSSQVAYLSPEQATPGAFVDESSDLFGLGAVLYVLLTGRAPFVGDSAEKVLEQLRGSTRVAKPTTLNAEIPPAVERIVLKLLAKHQEDRYQTPGELISDLEPLVEE